MRRDWGSMVVGFFIFGLLVFIFNTTDLTLNSSLFQHCIIWAYHPRFACLVRGRSFFCSYLPIAWRKRGYFRVGIDSGCLAPILRPSGGRPGRFLLRRLPNQVRLNSIWLQGSNLHALLRSETLFPQHFLVLYNSLLTPQKSYYAELVYRFLLFIIPYPISKIPTVHSNPR